MARKRRSNHSQREWLDGVGLPSISVGEIDFRKANNVKK